MFKHDLEKIGSAVSKHSKNIKGFGLSAKNLAENPKKKLAEFYLQDLQLFGCLRAFFILHIWDSVCPMTMQMIGCTAIRHLMKITIF